MCQRWGRKLRRLLNAPAGVRGRRFGSRRRVRLSCTWFGQAAQRKRKQERDLIPMKILVLNSGSSSQKACLYEIGETPPAHPPLPLWEGRIEWGSDTAAISVKNSRGGVQKENLKVRSREEFVRHLLNTL